MPLGLIVVAAWIGFVALFGLLLLGWALYSGQLDDLEETNWIPLREREPDPWPGRDAPTEVV